MLITAIPVIGPPGVASGSFGRRAPVTLLYNAQTTDLPLSPVPRESSANRNLHPDARLWTKDGLTADQGWFDRWLAD